MHVEPTLDEDGLVTESSRLGERGANLVEYAMLIAFIAIVCIAAVSALGGTTNVPYSEVGSAIGG